MRDLVVIFTYRHPLVRQPIPVNGVEIRVFFRLVKAPGQVAQPLGWVRVQELGYNVPGVLVCGLWYRTGG